MWITAAVKLWLQDLKVDMTFKKKKKNLKIPQGQFYIFILHYRQKEFGFPMLGPLFLNMKQRCFP